MQGKRVVVNTHGGFFHTKNMSLLKHIYFYTLNNLSLHLCDAVLLDSRNDEDIFRRILGKKMILTGIGVELSEYLKIRAKPENGRLLYIGRLSSNKGLQNLVKAVAVLAKEKEGIRLVIAGKDFDGTEARIRKIISLAGAEKNVELLGEITHERKMREISRARFCVSASEYEGFGIGVIEQMAAGNIPVLNNIRNFRWFVEDGKSGLVVNFSAAPVVAMRISEAMEMPQKKLDAMSAGAREAARHFEWENVLGEIEKSYRK